MNSRYFAAAFAVCLMSFAAMSALAGDKHARWAGNGLLLRGYDTTAYSRIHKPLIGRANVELSWKGGLWRFAAKENAAKFRANPLAYAPQFGAYCTGGLSQGHVVDGNPMYWRIHRGKLYLFFAAAGARRFDKGPEGVIAAARAYAKTVGIQEN